MADLGKQTLLEALGEWVEAIPDRTAIKDGEKALSYRQLNHLANQLAWELLRSSPGETRPAVVLVAEDLYRCCGFVAALKAGKIYVPLDPLNPLRRLEAILESMRPGTLLVDAKSQALVEHLSDADFPLIRIDEFEAGTASEDPPSPPSPDTLAWILHTSGSTGEPKGVMQTWRNITHYAKTVIEGLQLDSRDRLALASPMTVQGGAIYAVVGLASGATLYPSNPLNASPERFLRWLDVEGITVLISVPTLFRRLAEAISWHERLPKLRSIRLTGEPITKRDVELYRGRFASQCVLSIAYGTTETGGIRQAYYTKETRFSGERVPVNDEVEGVEIYLLDEEGGQAPFDQPGEIVVVSDTLSPGYWKRPDLTEAVFSTTEDGKRMYRTGDLGMMRPDGSMELLGRVDLQVKIRGQRVEIEEIESALLEIPFVRQTAVVAYQDEERDAHLAAYLVLDEAPEDAMSEIQRHLRATLPPAMVPARILFIDTLPLTSSGKVDRQALPPPEVATDEERAEFVAPRTEIEVALAEVWAEVFSLDQVGIYDDFLSLGGDSLSAMRLVGRILSLFRVEIPMPEIIDAATIQELAQRITAQLDSRGEEWGSLGS